MPSLLKRTKNIKLGLKLWSTNVECIGRARELYHKNIFDYVELFVVPGSQENCLGRWEAAGFPFVLHAPHAYKGLNFSVGELEEKNRAVLEEVEAFRGGLNPEFVIFHPGISGRPEETLRQVKMFRDEFRALFNAAVLENKPKLGLNAEICVGASPEEMAILLKETGLGFCLDMGHAIYYAAWRQADYEAVLERFLELKPQIFHLSDGKRASTKDVHLNLGEGDFDLAALVARIPPGACVSLETPRTSPANLDEFEHDVVYLQESLNGYDLKKYTTR